MPGSRIKTSDAHPKFQKVLDYLITDSQLYLLHELILNTYEPVDSREKKSATCLTMTDWLSRKSMTVVV